VDTAKLSANTCELFEVSNASLKVAHAHNDVVELHRRRLLT
jgi:hypothetical protein